MYWMTILLPWPKVTAVALININLLVCRIKWEPLMQSLQNLVDIYIWSCLLSDWIFWEILLDTFFAKFSFKIADVIFQCQTLYRTYLRNGWSDRCEMTWPITLTFDFSRSNFKLVVPQELLSDVKHEESKSVRYWTDCMVSPFDHTHDLDLEVIQGQSLK